MEEKDLAISGPYEEFRICFCGKIRSGFVEWYLIDVLVEEACLSEKTERSTRELTPFSVATHLPSYAALGGLIYSLGGQRRSYGGGDTLLNDVWLLDFKSLEDLKPGSIPSLSSKLRVEDREPTKIVRGVGDDIAETKLVPGPKPGSGKAQSQKSKKSSAEPLRGDTVAYIPPSSERLPFVGELLRGDGNKRSLECLPLAQAQKWAQKSSTSPTPPTAASFEDEDWKLGSGKAQSQKSEKLYSEHFRSHDILPGFGKAHSQKERIRGKGDISQLRGKGDISPPLPPRRGDFIRGKGDISPLLSLRRGDDLSSTEPLRRGDDILPTEPLRRGDDILPTELLRCGDDISPLLCGDDIPSLKHLRFGGEFVDILPASNEAQAQKSSERDDESRTRSQKLSEPLHDFVEISSHKLPESLHDCVEISSHKLPESRSDEIMCRAQKSSTSPTPPTAASVEDDVWKPGLPMNFARYNPHTMVVDHKLYVLGGFLPNQKNQAYGWIEVFDPEEKEKKWESLPSPPDQIHSSIMISGLLESKKEIIIAKQRWECHPLLFYSYNIMTRCWNTLVLSDSKASVRSKVDRAVILPPNIGRAVTVGNTLYWISTEEHNYECTIRAYDLDRNMWFEDHLNTATIFGRREYFSSIYSRGPGFLHLVDQKFCLLLQSTVTVTKKDPQLSIEYLYCVILDISPIYEHDHEDWGKFELTTVSVQKYSMDHYIDFLDCMLLHRGTGVKSVDLRERSTTQPHFPGG